MDDAQTIYRPAHIHMRKAGEGEQDLATEIYFKNVEHFTTDPASSSLLAANRILPTTKNKQGDEMVVLDIYMQKEFIPGNDGLKKNYRRLQL